MLTLPGGLVLGAMSPVTGRLFDKVGVRWLAPLGMTILVITLIGFANLTTSTSYTSVVILHVGFMFGVSMGMMPVMTNGLNQLPRRLHSHGTAIVNTLQQVSAALGTALLVTVISIGSRTSASSLPRRTISHSEHTRDQPGNRIRFYGLRGTCGSRLVALVLYEIHDEFG